MSLTMQRDNTLNKHTRIAKLHRKMAKRDEKANQPVFIREVVLRPQKTETCHLIIASDLPQHLVIGSYVLTKNAEEWKLFHIKVNKDGQCYPYFMPLQRLTRLKEKLFHLPLDSTPDTLPQEDILAIRKIITSYYQERHTLQEFSYGESPNVPTMSKEPHIHCNHYPHINSFERLIDHINLLAKIASIIHKECHDEQSSNHIVRLATPEFFFYTEEPLKPEQYEILLLTIKNIAQTLPPTIHFLLSSFARDAGDSVENASLYVICGPHPILHPIDKDSVAPHDISYPGKKMERDKALSSITSGVFVVETEGGESYLQAVEICLDNHFLRARKSTTEFITQPFDKQITFFPTQANQLLASNSVSEERKGRITNSFTHIDPIIPKDHAIYNLEQHQIADDLSALAPLKEKYPSLQIHLEKGKIKIVNPPFGADVVLSIQKEKPTQKMSEDLQAIIVEKNRQARKNLIGERLFSPLNEKSEYSDYLDKSHELAATCLAQLDILFLALSKQCEEKFYISLFHSNTYKNMAKENLLGAQSSLQPLSIKLKEDDNIFSFMEALQSVISQLMVSLTPSQQNDNAFLTELRMKTKAETTKILSPLLSHIGPLTTTLSL